MCTKKIAFLIVLTLSVIFMGCAAKNQNIQTPATPTPPANSKIERYEVIPYGGYPAIKVDLKVYDYPVTLALLDENGKILNWKVIDNATQIPAILYFSLIPISKNLNPGTYYIQLRSGTPFGEIKEVKQISQDEYIIRWKASKELDTKKLVLKGSKLEILNIQPETAEYFGDCALVRLKLLVKNTGDFPVYFDSFGTAATIIFDKDKKGSYFVKGGPVAPGEEKWISVESVLFIETFKPYSEHYIEIYLKDGEYVLAKATSMLKIDYCKSFASTTEKIEDSNPIIKVENAYFTAKYNYISNSYDLVVTLVVRNYGNLPANVEKVAINVKGREIYLRPSENSFSPLGFYLGPNSVIKVVGFADVDLKAYELKSLPIELYFQSKGAKILTKHLTTLAFSPPRIKFSNVNFETTYWKYLNKGSIVKISFLATNIGDLPTRIEKLIIFVDGVSKEYLIYKDIQPGATIQVEEPSYIDLTTGVHKITIELFSPDNAVIGIYQTKISIPK